MHVSGASTGPSFQPNQHRPLPPQLQREGMSSILRGLGLRSQDIQSVSIRSAQNMGAHVLEVKKHTLKSIKEKIDQIQTMNQKDLDHLMTIFGLSSQSVVVNDREGGYVIIEESIQTIKEKEEEEEEHSKDDNEHS